MMKKTNASAARVGLGLLILVGLAGLAWLALGWWQQQAGAPATAEPAAPRVVGTVLPALPPMAMPTASAPINPAKPAIAHPIEAAPAAQAATAAAATATALPPADAPALLGRLFGRQALLAMFQTDDFARRLVATVAHRTPPLLTEIGRASCRERVYSSV